MALLETVFGREGASVLSLFFYFYAVSFILSPGIMIQSREQGAVQ
jgi:hypothetical protein